MGAEERERRVGREEEGEGGERVELRKRKRGEKREMEKRGRGRREVR